MIRPGSRERTVRSAILLAGDFILAWAVLAVTVYVRRTIPLPFTQSLLPAEKLHLDPIVVTLFGASFVVSLALAGFYRMRAMARSRPILLIALVFQLALVAVGASVLDHPVPRTVLFAILLLEGLLFPLLRSVTIWPVRPRETILIGSPDEVTAAVAVLEGEGERRIKVTGHAGEGPAGVDAPWLGPLHDPQVRAAVRDAEEVICVSAQTGEQGRLELLRIRGPRGYLLQASSADALLISNVLGWMGDEPLIEVAVDCGFGVRGFVKRLVDIAGAVVLLVLSLPLSIAISLALLLDDGRPILLRQLRLGRDGVPFGMWKFRSMRFETEEEKPDSERVTRTGRFLRRYRLDELPQVINVLTGDMSLVGPRPERPEIAARIMEDVPDFDLRCLVRPGIAGLAQILAEYDSRPAVKLRYDLTYMCSWSLWLDLRLLLSSIATALSGSGI
jgi:lipopolysaccharide/colanic/teichoic acid biosynthesis glycosyltransferase